MMRLTKRLLAGIVLASVATGAGAADLRRGELPAPLAPPVLPEDFSSGWYVRGDFSARLPRRPGITAFDGAGFAPGLSADLHDTRAATAFGGGLGLGFKYKWLRLDATLDWRAPASVSGLAPAGGDWAYAGPLPNPARTERFKVTSQTALLNAYAEFGAFGPVSPYVGLGLGVARLTASNYSSTPVPAAAALGEAVITPGLVGATRWTLAYAAMAGLAVDLSPQVKLDIGYRYVSMGSLRFGDTAGGAYRVAPVAAHEARIGLRYMFGDGLPPGP